MEKDENRIQSVTEERPHPHSLFYSTVFGIDRKLLQRGISFTVNLSDIARFGAITGMEFASHLL